MLVVPYMMPNEFGASVVEWPKGFVAVGGIWGGRCVGVKGECVGVVNSIFNVHGSNSPYINHREFGKHRVFHDPYVATIDCGVGRLVVKGGWLITSAADHPTRTKPKPIRTPTRSAGSVGLRIIRPCDIAEQL